MSNENAEWFANTFETDDRHNVGRPFMIIATQNPFDHDGTYNLPTSQLDRFLIRTSLGSADQESTIALLADSAGVTGQRLYTP